jgi:transposase-like protein
MSLGRVVITAVIVEGRSKSEVARDYGVSRVWVQNWRTAISGKARSRSSPGPGVRTPTRVRSTWMSKTGSSGCGRR